jgi:hypothetical protein
MIQSEFCIGIGPSDHIFDKVIEEEESCINNQNE